MCAVYPKLVGSAGDGPKCQLGDSFFAFQNRKLCAGRLAFLVYITQKAGKGAAGDRGIDNTGIGIGAAKDQSVVSLFQLSFRVKLVENSVNVGILSQQHNAKGVPIQTGNGMERAFLSCSSNASSTLSEILSQILSGCPSVTDSDVKNNFSIFLISFILYFRKVICCFP